MTECQVLATIYFTYLMFVCLFYLYLSAFPYLYLYLQPMTLGQEGLLTDHLLPSNKIFWIQ